LSACDEQDRYLIKINSINGDGMLRDRLKVGRLFFIMRNFIHLISPIHYDLI